MNGTPLLVRGVMAHRPPADDREAGVRNGATVVVRERPWVWPEQTSIIGALVTLDAADSDSIDSARPTLDIRMPESVVHSVVDRRRTFLAGRACAALALARAGIAGATAIGIADHRGPQWPDGIVGSISHVDDVAAAAVASARDYRGIGIDIQPLLSVDVARELAHMVAPEWPTTWNDGYGPMSYARAITTVFSAKESLFKCVRPLVPDYFDFADARLIAWEPAAERGALQLLRTLSGDVQVGQRFDVALRWQGTTLHSLIAWRR